MLVHLSDDQQKRLFLDTSDSSLIPVATLHEPEQPYGESWFDLTKETAPESNRLEDTALRLQLHRSTWRLFQEHLGLCQIHQDRNRGLADLLYERVSHGAAMDHIHGLGVVELL